MCLPAAAMAVASAVVSSAGAIVGGLSQQQALQQRERQYQMQSQMENRQANIEQATGQYAQARRREQLDRALGNQRVAMSASGLERSGSMTDIALSSRSEGELDIAAIRYNTDLKSGNLRYQSQVSAANAEAAGNAAQMAGITTAIGAVAPFVSLGANPAAAGMMSAGASPAPMNINPLNPNFGVMNPGIPRVRLGLNF